MNTYVYIDILDTVFINVMIQNFQKTKWRAPLLVSAGWNPGRESRNSVQSRQGAIAGEPASSLKTTLSEENLHRSETQQLFQM